MRHCRLIYATLCFLVLGFSAVVCLGAVSYDVAVRSIAPTNAPGGKFVGSTLTLKVTVINNGPGQINANDGLKVIVSRFDHTGQQFLKEIGRRELFLLQPYNNNPDNMMVVTFDDTNPPIGSYFYRAGIGAASYYTDPNNANNKAETFIQVSQPLSWTSRLWPQDFTRAGVTLSSTQATKLNNNTYTLQSIVSGSTDRFTDSNKCMSCHSGAATQSAAKYQPIFDSGVIKVDRDHKLQKGDANATAGYRWNASGSGGVVPRFINSTYSKPVDLEKIFQLWLNDGGRP